MSDALRKRDESALRAALCSRDVVVLYVDTPEGHCPVILTDKQGHHSIAAFSSQEALDAWDTAALVGVIRGSELPALGLRQGVDAILIDPAGPVPAAFAPAALRDIVDDIQRGPQFGQVLCGDQVFTEPTADDRSLQVRQAVRTLLPPSSQAYLVDRMVMNHRILTLAVDGSAAEIRLLVEALAGTLSLELDVIKLSKDVKRALSAQAPQCKILI